MTNPNSKNKEQDDTKDLRHDLKNKLTVIQGYAELLMTKVGNEKEKRWVNEILNSTQELYKLIDEKIR